MLPLCRLSFRDGLPQGNVKIELLASSADSAMLTCVPGSPARKSCLSDCLDMTHKIDKMAPHAGARPSRIQSHNRQSQSASSIMHRPSSTQDIVSSHLLAVNVAFPFTEYQDQHPLEKNPQALIAWIHSNRAGILPWAGEKRDLSRLSNLTTSPIASLSLSPWYLALLMGGSITQRALFCRDCLLEL